jgi:hypothetical protein
MSCSPVKQKLSLSFNVSFGIFKADKATKLLNRLMSVISTSPSVVYRIVPNEDKYLSRFLLCHHRQVQEHSPQER